jgi:hypothetical protein
MSAFVRRFGFARPGILFGLRWIYIHVEHNEPKQIPYNCQVSGLLATVVLVLLLHLGGVDVSVTSSLNQTAAKRLLIQNMRRRQ